MENEWRKVKTSFSSPSFWQIEEKVFTLQRKFEIRKIKKNEEKFLDSMGRCLFNLSRLSWLRHPMRRS